MLDIFPVEALGIGEYRSGFLEGDPVLFEIDHSLSGIPGKHIFVYTVIRPAGTPDRAVSAVMFRQWAVYFSFGKKFLRGLAGGRWIFVARPTRPQQLRYQRGSQWPLRQYAWFCLVVVVQLATFGSYAFGQEVTASVSKYL